MSATEVLSALDRIHGTVSVIGSMNADYTVTAQRLPGPGETITGGPLQLLPGGKSGNQAAAAARIGATVQMFGAVGSDSNADFLLGALGEAGVNTTHVRRVLGPSGTTVITVDAAGENTIVYSPGSNAQVTVDYVESVRDALARSSVLGLCLESPIETVTAAARMCHEAGVKVLLNDSPFTPSLPAELVEASDILLVNEHEMVQLLGIDEPENDDWDGFDWNHALEAMRGFGFEQAIVTLGGDGSVYRDGDTVFRQGIYKVPVVDTTAAGDTFTGYFLAGVLSDLPMDETLALCAVDLGGRPYFVYDASFAGQSCGGMDTQMAREFFYAVSYSAMMNLHLKVLYGENDHHKLEAMFKAFAKALDAATRRDARIDGVLSTKGTL